MIDQRLLDGIKDAVSYLEETLARIHDMPIEDQVELAARIRGIRKKTESVGKIAKTNVRNTLHWEELPDGVDHFVKGHDQQAILKVVPTRLLDQAWFKELQPTLHGRYVKVHRIPRVRFEYR